MAKKVTAIIKLQIKGGAANPSPPVGPALGAKGVNIVEFCKQFNDATNNEQLAGKLVPVEITVFTDKSFIFITKTPPAAFQILEVLKIKKGSSEPNKNKIGNISWSQIKTIAELKMKDMNCFRVESAMKMIAGSARSMGITVSGDSPF